MYNYPLALTASFISTVFVGASYFVTKKSLYLTFQALCIVFLIASYFFTAQFFAMVGLALGLARTLIFYVFEKRDKVAPIWVAFALSAATLTSYFIVNLGILKTAQPLDLLCVTALIMYAFIFRIRNLKIVRFTMLIPTVFSILFNTLTGAAFFASITYVIELTANVVSIYKYHIKNENEETQNVSKENTNENS